MQLGRFAMRNGVLAMRRGRLPVQTGIQCACPRRDSLPAAACCTANLLFQPTQCGCMLGKMPGAP